MQFLFWNITARHYEKVDEKTENRFVFVCVADLNLHPRECTNTNPNPIHLISWAFSISSLQELMDIFEPRVELRLLNHLFHLPAHTHSQYEHHCTHFVSLLL
eukprot:GHVO01004621.1.p2 GENE.GHVO01004621.1~~GHVO01004621.1.p2  ORF type:complete len:102 (-),score=2.17 GHVO01004621.1:309-614(-)